MDAKSGELNSPLLPVVSLTLSALNRRYDESRRKKKKQRKKLKVEESRHGKKKKREKNESGPFEGGEVDHEFLHRFRKSVFGSRRT